jgi:hypothetical protein
MLNLEFWGCAIKAFLESFFEMKLITVGVLIEHLTKLWAGERVRCRAQQCELVTEAMRPFIYPLSAAQTSEHFFV